MSCLFFTCKLQGKDWFNVKEDLSLYIHKCCQLSWRTLISTYFLIKLLTIHKHFSIYVKVSNLYFFYQDLVVTLGCQTCSTSLFAETRPTGWTFGELKGFFPLLELSIYFIDNLFSKVEKTKKLENCKKNKNKKLSIQGFVETEINLTNLALTTTMTQNNTERCIRNHNQLRGPNNL